MLGRTRTPSLTLNAVLLRALLPRDRPGSPAWVGAQQACTKSRAWAGHQAEQHARMAAAMPRQGSVVRMEQVFGSALPATRFSDPWEQKVGAMNY